MLTQLLRCFRSGYPQNSHGRPRRLSFVPGVEVLEGRDLPSTMTVTNLSDTGAGSLRGVLAAAQPGDTINFQTGLHGSIPLGSRLYLARNVNIQGTLDVSGNPLVTLDGQHSVQDVFVNTGVTASLADLGIANGYAPGMDIGQGGGILNDGALTIQGCKITGNVTGSTVVAGTGTVTSVSGYGGGICNLGTLTVQNSTLSGNTAGGFGTGGAIYSVMGIWVHPTPPAPMQWRAATATIIGCTFTGNTATWGGAIGTSGGSLTITNTTITGNMATIDGGGIYIHPPQYALASAIDASSTSISVGSTVYFVNAQILQIDNEQMTVTGVDTVYNTVLVTRGVNHTTAAAHLLHAAVISITATIDAFSVAHLTNNTAPSDANIYGPYAAL